MSRYTFYQNDFDEFVEVIIPRYYEKSHFAGKILNEIFNEFPKKLNDSILAERLNISSRWLQQQCRLSFRMTYAQLVRSMKLYYALKLLHETNLDIIEIALQLNYKNTSAIHRDFKKQFAQSPTKMRVKLSTATPIQVFQACSLY